MPSQPSDRNEAAGATSQPSADTSGQDGEPPYTLTRSASGNNLQVDFTSGPREGENIAINLQEVRERTERAREQERNQPVQRERYEYREEDLPAVSYHDADGRLISKEEYEVLAARELAEEERRNAGGQAERQVAGAEEQEDES